MSRGPRGMVLPLSLFALVVIGAIVGGALGLALLEQRTGRNALYAVQAAGAAEAGAVAVMGAWAGYGLDALLPGDSAVMAPVQLPGSSSYRASVHRLNPELFELRVAGLREDADGGILARRELGLILRRVDGASSGIAPLATRAWDMMSP